MTARRRETGDGRGREEERTSFKRYRKMENVENGSEGMEEEERGREKVIKKWEHNKRLSGIERGIIEKKTEESRNEKISELMGREAE